MTSTRAEVSNDPELDAAAASFPEGESSSGELTPDSPDAWVIEPRTQSVRSQITELWEYRHLFRFFGQRALEKRYQRTVLGFWWLIIRPLFPIVISVFVFGNVMGVTSGGVPYFLFMTVGMSHWRVFGSSLMWGTRSLELNRGVMKQLYFPRLIMLPATMVPALLEMAIYSVLIAITVGYFYVTSGTLWLNLGPAALLGVAAILLTFLFSFSISLFTSIFGARARDLRFSLSYILNFWMLLTPVVYPLDYIPDQWRWVVYFNPMAALVKAFKWGLFGIGSFDPWGFVSALAIMLFLLATGLVFFNRAEATSVDRL